MKKNDIKKLLRDNDELNILDLDEYDDDNVFS